MHVYLPHAVQAYNIRALSALNVLRPSLHGRPFAISCMCLVKYMVAKHGIILASVYAI